MVDELEQLLLRPRRRRLRAQVVEHEHRRVAHALEQLVVADLRARLVRRAQVVQQVRHDDEQRRLAALEQPVDDRRGDVRLAAAARAGEHEPAVRRIGERARVVDAALVLLLLARPGAASARDEVRERQPRQRADVRVARQPIAARAPLLSSDAQRHGTTSPKSGWSNGTLTRT